MIEDATHLGVLDGHTREIYDLLSHFNARMNGLTNKVQLIDLHTERGRSLVELLNEQKRALDFMAGRPVEPKTHLAEGILVGVVGGSAQ